MEVLKINPMDWLKTGKDKFPPQLSYGERLVLYALCYPFFFVIPVAYLIEQFCLGYLPCSLCWTYVAFASVLVGVLIDRNMRQKLSFHEARLEDESEIKALILEARSVEPRLSDPEKPNNYTEQKKELQDRADSLEKNGPREWTEYQVLPLDLLNVDFLKENDLKSRVRSTLSELEDYAEDSTYRYEWNQYFKWQGRIDQAIDKIGEQDDEDLEARDERASTLRAELKMLLEYLANSQMNWSEGSVRTRNLMIFGVIAIPVFIIMGLLPILHPCDNGTLIILNWGLLGISGSLTAVLLDLRKSDLVEVGNTEGKKEVRRAILGATLGFVAAVLAYSMISGGMLTGIIVPDLKSVDGRSLEVVGLSVVWAITSGFSFERIFDRVRSTTAGNA